MKTKNPTFRKQSKEKHHNKLVQNEAIKFIISFGRSQPEKFYRMEWRSVCSMFLPQAAEHNNKLVSVIGNDKKKEKKEIHARILKEVSR